VTTTVNFMSTSNMSRTLFRGREGGRERERQSARASGGREREKKRESLERGEREGFH
jgi:hypothetical protein